MAFSLLLCIKATCSFARPLFCFSAACCPVVDMWRLRRVGKSRIQHSVLAHMPLVARTCQEVGCRHDGSSGFLEKCCSSVDPAAALATFLLSSIMVSFVTEKSLLTKWQFVFLIGCAVSSEAWQGSQLESAPESHPKQCFAFSDLIALLSVQSRHVSAVSSFPPLFQKMQSFTPRSCVDLQTKVHPSC